jgi:hypothetical protein
MQLRNSARNLVSAEFDVGPVLFSVRGPVRGVAVATCELEVGLAAIDFVAEFGVPPELPAANDVPASGDEAPPTVADLLLSIAGPVPALAEELLSIDLLALGLADVLAADLLAADFGVLGARGLTLVPALAGLFLRHSRNAAPSISLHGADELDKGGDVVAEPAVDGA